MTITKNQNGTALEIALEGRLDTMTAPELETELKGSRDGAESLVLDLSKLEYISSSGLRAVVAAYKKMNGALTVRNASEGVMSIVKTTGIDKRIKFE